MAEEKAICCPSAEANWEGSTLLGVVGGTVEAPRVAYLTTPQPVTGELLALTGAVKPEEVLRFAAPCAGNACQHFDGAECRLVKKVVRLLPLVVEKLPACHLRPHCRWWKQEGRAACLRCPQIVSESYQPSEALRLVADPTVD